MADFTKPFQFTCGGDSTVYTYTHTNSDNYFVITWDNGECYTEYPLDNAKSFLKNGVWVVVPSLRSLYEAERDKLTFQQAVTTVAWELVVAEKASEDSVRKSLIHAKQCLVDRARDTLKESSDFYLQISKELDEMLRNEPF